MSLLMFMVFILAVVYILKGVVIVQQMEEVIIERFGKYHRTLTPGLNFIIPFVDTPANMNWKVSQVGIDGQVYSHTKILHRIDKRESVHDFKRQNVITKDNVTISINALLYFQIVDSKSAVYEISNLIDAIEKLTQTNLRNLVGQLDLDETLISRDKINRELREILDDATSKWGVKVNRVELQDINPPADIQQAMEKQMKAEREKRAVILESEGQKQAMILKAQGEKEAAINRAEGEKQAKILKADGIAKARVLEAEGEKQAVQMIIEAIGDNGKPDQYLIAMKYLETLKNIASGQNNKVVYMPYEATGVLSSVDGIKQMFDGVKNAK